MPSFGSLGALAAHFEEKLAELPLVQQSALETIGDAVMNEAKRKLGTYQPIVGRWELWAPLAPKTVADRINKGFTPDDPLFRSGALRESIEYIADTHSVSIGTYDIIGLYQELGTFRQGMPIIPPRAFLAPALFEYMPEAVEIIINRIGTHLIRG